MVVEHHLRLPGGAGGKVDHHRVGALRLLHAGDFHQAPGDRGGVGSLLDVAHPAGEVGVGDQPAGKRRAVVADLLHLGGVFRVGDDHLDLCGIDPVAEVLRGEHRRAGAEDRSELDAGDGEDPPLRDPWEHDDDPVALLDPVLQEHVCRRVGEVHQLAEGEGLLLPLLVHPDHGQPVPVGKAEPVDHIKTEVVVFGDLDPEIPVGLLVVVHSMTGAWHMN